jgi:lipopolysaccharide/colanic/teichoic acid biosynthesis glycosyltransferase
VTDPLGIDVRGGCGPSGSPRMARRLFDASVAAVGLLLVSLPLALAAAAVKFTSPGPVLYRQVRIGRHGRPFHLYKLRTMHAGATGAHITVATDARVTPVGRVLRRFKIDELPQLWNILKNDMGLIGPRPEVPRFVDRYSPEQRRILEALPGLASHAQLVFPHEADLLDGSADPEETYATELMPRKIAIDLAYECCRSFWTDLALMAEIGLSVAGVRCRMDRELRMDGTGAIAAAASRGGPRNS